MALVSPAYGPGTLSDGKLGSLGNSVAVGHPKLLADEQLKGKGEKASTAHVERGGVVGFGEHLHQRDRRGRGCTAI